MSRILRSGAVAALAASIATCADVTAPEHSDVDFARAVWLQQRPANYSFEVSTASMISSFREYLKVTVRNGQVTQVLKPDGSPSGSTVMMIDALWEGILSARATGKLNFAEFDTRGVPLVADYGEWALDGGVRYEIRGFAKE